MVTNSSIIFRGLTKKFGSFTAVDQIDLEVRAGEFFGFLGPNGAGKTTTIKMAVGLLQKTAGQVIIAGHDIDKEPLEVKRQVGVLPEELNLYERLTGKEFLWFAGRMYGLSRAQAESRTEELLDLMELQEHRDKMIIDYSQGMKKKVALGAALIHNPKVLFLDEPFGGIDAISSHAIRNVLHQLTAHGVTIFFSSHILEVVEKLCREVAIIHRGKIVGRGSMNELRQKAEFREDASLEDVFLKLVEAKIEKEDLSWLS